ncbi:hypothetical protein O181_024803 [Austropuccinia psidii MF-1]|uniref:Uncharacterized protein n=1 Tax=Austropuccinia psidii MF-1 TaxID=1389203 RepID=A0A9Q3CJK0_9BASI|nr:hypothetical protein [Austropuccinia psidii MF-1]
MKYNLASENKDYLEIKGYLSADLIETIRKRLKEVIVPQGISHIPSRMGTAQTGKLKANECSITKDDADLFKQAYATYKNTSEILFPNIQVAPNHHYSMHIPEQFMRWGPLNGISEYAGERLIGIPQKFKTSSLNGEVEETLMKKFGQLQRLQHSKPEAEVSPSNEEAPSTTKKKILDDASYDQFLKHLQKRQRKLCHYCDLPHPINSSVLKNLVIEHVYASWKFGMIVSKYMPNDLIYLRNTEGKFEFGRILHILDLANDSI